MSAPLIHITASGLAILRGIKKTKAALVAAGVPLDTRACDGKRVTVRDYERGRVVLGVLTTLRLPTCPRCAVLRDEALKSSKPRTLTSRRGCDMCGGMTK